MPTISASQNNSLASSLENALFPQHGMCARAERLAAGFASVLVALAVILGGTGAARPHAAAAANATITMATVADPIFNLWAPNAFAESDVIDPLLFSGLTKWALNGQPQGDLATSWSVSANKLVWTFNLRHGVRWQDGQPFTAQDVAYTFDAIALNKKLGSNKASNFTAVTTVRVVGPNTVQFVLNTPWSALPSYLAWFAPILPRHLFLGHNPWTLTSFDKQHPVGTGPYMLSKYVPGQSLTLTRNPTYFGAKPQIQTIIFEIIPQDTTQVSDLLSGNLNYIEVQSPQLLGPLQSNPNVAVQKVVQQDYYFVTLNTALPQFKDVRVRQALDDAIDKNGLIQALLKGNGQVATGPIAPLQQAYYNPHVAHYPYNPQRALQLLAQAGYTKGRDGKLAKNGHPLTITLTAGQYGYLVPASELIQRYWQQLGVTVNLHTIEWNAYIQQVVVKRDYEASFVWWIAPFDPDVYPYYSCSNAFVGDNISNYCNPQLDSLMTQGRAVVAPAQRKRVYDRMQSLMAVQLPLLYMFYPQRFAAMSRTLHVPAVDYDIAIDNMADWTVSGS